MARKKVSFSAFLDNLAPETYIVRIRRFKLKTNHRVFIDNYFLNIFSTPIKNCLPRQLRQMHLKAQFLNERGDLQQTLQATLVYNK